MKITKIIDLTKEICPMTFVKTLMALDTLEYSQVLEVHVSGDEPLSNVKKSVEELGHEVAVQQNDNHNNVVKLLIKKKEKKDNILKTNVLIEW